MSLEHDENKSFEFNNAQVITSQDKLVAAFIKLSGISSPTALARELDIPPETARTWIRRCRNKGFNLTGSISPGVQSHRFNLTGSGSISPVEPRAHAYKESPTEINNSNIISFSDHIEKPAPKQKPKSKGSRLPEDWQLKKIDRDWVEVNLPAFPEGQISDQADRFRDYWISQPGQKGVRTNWRATWRNWMRKALDDHNRQKRFSQPKKSQEEIASEKFIEKIKRESRDQQPVLPANGGSLLF